MLYFRFKFGETNSKLEVLKKLDKSTVMNEIEK